MTEAALRVRAPELVALPAALGIKAGAGSGGSFMRRAPSVGEG
jgi:hypothetical protein